jgi:hypothetical protein
MEYMLTSDVWRCSGRQHDRADYTEKKLEKMYTSISLCNGSNKKSDWICRDCQTDGARDGRLYISRD